MPKSTEDASHAADTSDALRRSSKPINDGIFTRVVTLLAAKILDQKYMRRIWKQPSGVLFGFRFCIKTSPITTLAEAHVLQFVANNTSIPVPKVYSAFAHRGQVYIVMERIGGNMLAKGWVCRSEESKAKILNQLRGMIQQLRDIRPPSDYAVANINGGPIFDDRLSGSSLKGPFRTIHDFHRELREHADPGKMNAAALPDDLLEFFAFHGQQTASRPTLTHGDLSSLNILARGDDVVGIIDWETSGWFPSYWEYVTAWNVNPQNEFWRDEVDKFLAPMPYELKMDSVRRRYFGDF
ncbi:kinase-like protein [Nemania serpens]|nr:kinase-like protein [Nemania serpens]